MIHNTTLRLMEELEADAAAHRQSKLAHLRELRDQPAKDDVEVES